MITNSNSEKKTRRLRIASQTSVTVEGIANYCLVSECTVRRWIKDGKLSAIRLPSGQYRITTTGFKDFLTRYDIPVREL
jgi:excisionase family DNA binding protein